jgi:hypothetical protein
MPQTKRPTLPKTRPSNALVSIPIDAASGRMFDPHRAAQLEAIA